MNNPSPPPPSPLRIAILECDIPIGNTRAKYGGYGNLFEELLLKGKDELVREGRDGRKEGVDLLPELDLPELDVTKFNVVDEELYPRLEEVDVVLVSGSREFCPLPVFWCISVLCFVISLRCNILVRFDQQPTNVKQVSTPSTTIFGSLNWWILSRKCSLSRRGCGWSEFVSAIRLSAALLGRKLGGVRVGGKSV